MHDYLIEIIQKKKAAIAQLKKQLACDTQHPINQLLAGKLTKTVQKDFTQALQQAPISIIAEIKRRSPSKGQLATIKDPVSLAKRYVEGGANAISVLTDEYAFNGSLQDLTDVATALANHKVAILRKDFILDEIQIAEALLAGADAILLIVKVLEDKTAKLLSVAKQLKIPALVEVHDAHELNYASNIGAEIIGINNRDLTTFQVNTQHALDLKAQIAPGIISVAESGIHDLTIAQRYCAAGFNALLIGEALVKQSDPQHFIQELRNHK